MNEAPQKKPAVPVYYGLSEIGALINSVRRGFEGIPRHWYTTFHKVNPATGHLNLHYRCEIRECRRVFKKASNIKEHFKTHTKSQPHLCKLCRRRFSQVGNLRKHLELIHGIAGKPCKMTKSPVVF